MIQYMKTTKINFILFCIMFLLPACSDVGSLVDVAIQNETRLETDVNVNQINKNKINSVKVLDQNVENTDNIKPNLLANPRYKVGDPYEIKGIWYYPKRDLTYSSSGIASWYGKKFHGKMTANGEIFDKNIVSAAHRTLPMPSMVKVTNLDNGRILNVRINDRGPYIAGRIIDLSEKAAELLGFKELGVARVKVEILVEQSLWLERSAKDGIFPTQNNLMQADLPKINSAQRPKVQKNQIVLKTNEINSDNQNVKTMTFTELIASGKTGNLRNTNPKETKIWIQIGAFSSINNLDQVINKVSDIYEYDVSTVLVDEKVLHRIRLGPTQDLNIADDILEKVFSLGYFGSQIIVE